MLSFAALAVAALLPSGLAQTLSNETVLGVYMFHRHGDRTAKSWPPTSLTDLGYQEVYSSGQYYRSRYIASGAAYQINGISSDMVVQSQIQVSAPDDDVLQNSAMGFLQGFYPPVGSTMAQQTLRNQTVITAPMDGYQLIPVELVSSGASENSAWLQSSSGCAAATVASDDYYLSTQYMDLLSGTHDFYQSLLPVINGTFNSSTATYKNAYLIFDLLNVAEIHNATINSSQLLTNETMLQVSSLANAHEWGLGYNASDTISAIGGMTLAAQVVQFLNGTITSNGQQKIAIQFGAYNSFGSFFGLANLTSVDPDAYGIVDYASAMTFELFTNATTSISSTSYPSTDDMYVRFLFHNGTTTNASAPVAYPLFGMGEEVLSWNDFTTGMNKFAVGTTEQWCVACANYTGSCAAYAPGGSNGSSTSTSGSSSGNGLSPAVNGVIGAMVTLGVILGLEALILLLGGLRIVSKKRFAQGNGTIGHNASGAQKA